MPFWFFANSIPSAPSQMSFGSLRKVEPVKVIQTAYQLLNLQGIFSFRELVALDDGGQTAVDWRLPEYAEFSDDSPIVIFLPGITGVE